MFDAFPTAATPSVAEARRHFGLERRHTPVPVAHQWLAATLDEIDYGMLMLQDEVRVIHANHAARVELDGAHALRLLGRELHARRPADAQPLAEALHAATRRGLRKMLTLGEGGHRVTMSIVPLTLAGVAAAPVTLVMLGKRPGSEALSVHGFAQSHGLTVAETRVLNGLCCGTLPSRIAADSGIAISTVRSHIGSIRRKTGAPSICALVQQVAALPPLRGVLRGLTDGFGPFALND